jgi:hypothetical protein
MKVQSTIDRVYSTKKTRALKRIAPFVRLFHLYTLNLATDSKRLANLETYGDTCALESRTLNELVKLDETIVRCPDGALQDFLMPRADLFLPIQLKTAAALHKDRNYRFGDTGNGKNKKIKYENMLIVFVALVGEERHWWILKDVEATDVGVRIGKDYIDNSGENLTLARNEGLEKLLATLRALAFEPCIRIQDVKIPSEKTEAEHKLAFLIRENLKGLYRRPEIQNAVCDDLVLYKTGADRWLKAQNKTVKTVKSKGVQVAGLHCSMLNKNIGTIDGKCTHGPYEIDDNDVYVFGCIFETAVFLWKIPESALIEHNRVGEGAKPSLMVHVDKDYDEVKALKVIQKNSTAWTADFFVGRFEITNAQREALEDGRYLEALVCDITVRL